MKPVRNSGKSLTDEARLERLSVYNNLKISASKNFFS